MKDVVFVGGLPFYYTEHKLFHGRKVINKELSAENLRIFCEVLRGTSIRFGLVFGTLLGAVREGDFIDYDEDTDLFVLGEDRERFLDLLPILRENCLELVRYRDGFISLMRKDEYIDVYFFERKTKISLSAIRTFNNAYELPAQLLEEVSEVPFQGVMINIPKDSESVLEIFYGKEWRTPIRNKSAQGNSVKYKLSKSIPMLRRIPGFKGLKRIVKHLLSRF